MSRKSVTSSNPIVKISRRGAQRLKSGHVWVYRSDVVAADGVGPGALVSVHDERGKPMGTALYSTASQIAVRMIARDALLMPSPIVSEWCKIAMPIASSSVKLTFCPG